MGKSIISCVVGVGMAYLGYLSASNPTLGGIVGWNLLMLWCVGGLLLGVLVFSGRDFDDGITSSNIIFAVHLILHLFYPIQALFGQNQSSLFTGFLIGASIMLITTAIEFLWYFISDRISQNARKTERKQQIAEQKREEHLQWENSMRNRIDSMFR